MHPLEIDWRNPDQQTVLASLRERGAVLVRNAPLNPDSLSAAFQAQARMFSLPEDVKERLRAPDGNSHSGYIPFGRELSNKGVAPDPKEAWHVSRDSLFPNVWIQDQPEFKTAHEALWKELDSFSVEYMGLLGKLIGDEVYARSIMTEHNSVIRMVRYHRAQAGGELAGAHRDIGLFTIHLHRTHPGYEVYDGREWHSIGCDSNSIMISSGDMLEHISNGEFVSVTHRVRNVPGHHVYRSFCGYFVHPGVHAVLKCHPRPGAQPRFADLPSIDVLDGRARDINIGY